MAEHRYSSSPPTPPRPSSREYNYEYSPPPSFPPTTRSPALNPFSPLPQSPPVAQLLSTPRAPSPTLHSHRTSYSAPTRTNHSRSPNPHNASSQLPRRSCASVDVNAGSSGKKWRVDSLQEPPAAYRASHDGEKSSTLGTSPNSPHGFSTTSGYIALDMPTKRDFENRRLEDKAPGILIYLSGPCFFVSLVLAFYTLPSLLLTLILSPFKSFNFSSQLSRFLAPALRLQLRLISSPLTSKLQSATMSPLSSSASSPNRHHHHHHHRASTTTEPLQNKPISTLVILLLSPFVAGAVALAAWTTALFWFYVAVLGNPDGKDRVNDGRMTVLALRARWEAWLARGFAKGATDVGGNSTSRNGSAAATAAGERGRSRRSGQAAGSRDQQQPQQQRRSRTQQQMTEVRRPSHMNTSIV